MKNSVQSFNMISIKMVNFYKTANCPSSQDLLAFENGKTVEQESEEIRWHLARCEFCASEVEFYAHYPPAEETVAKVEIPLPLYELAQALLSNKHKDFSLLDQLLGEKETIKI